MDPHPTVPSLTSDEELVELCRMQLPYTTIAFEQLLHRYEAIVFRTCLQYLGNNEDAEEVCQDVFMRVFHHISSFEGRSTFRTWLFRITYNLCNTRRSKNLKRADRSELGSKEDYKSSKAEDTGGLVAQALQELSEQDRDLVVMRFVTELKIAEIAETLGIRLSAAKMRLYRSIERFRSVYNSLAKRRN